MSTPVGGDIGRPSDKLAVPLNAPAGGQTVSGVQPGVSSGVVLAQYVIVFGQTAGVFIYAGSPGPGNPPVYSFSNADTDPYGNAIEPGIWAGVPGGVQTGFQESATAGRQFFLVPGGPFAANAEMIGAEITGGSQLAMFSAAELAPKNDRVFLAAYSNSAAPVPGSATMQLGYFDITAAFHQFMAFNWSGMFLAAVESLTAVQPGTGTGTGNVAVEESWHTASLSGTWTGSGSGENGLFYRLLAVGSVGAQLVEVKFDIINTTATGNSTCFTLPAGYRPATTQNHPCGWNNPAVNNSASVPWITVFATGVIQVTAIEVANKEIFGHIFIPLGTL